MLAWDLRLRISHTLVIKQIKKSVAHTKLRIFVGLCICSDPQDKTTIAEKFISDEASLSALWFSSERKNLSPFTKDFRGLDHSKVYSSFCRRSDTTYLISKEQSQSVYVCLCATRPAHAVRILYVLDNVCNQYNTTLFPSRSPTPIIYRYERSITRCFHPHWNFAIVEVDIAWKFVT